MKPHDIFISYSSLDSEFVENLVSKLRSKGVSLWFDKSEIKPGDYLRERINAAIDNVDYLLTVISENSISSEWVRREIDSAMVRELDEKQIRLIPLLIGDVKPSNLPADIRGKNFLDFRNEDIGKRDFERLLHLLKPELRLRKEFLKELRKGMPNRDNPVTKLCETACAYGDQTIQKAAIGGLVRIGTSEAVIAIAQRLLDYWGMSTLTYCINALVRLRDVGGLLVISSSLFWDDRYVGEKMAILLDEEKDNKDFMNFVEKRTFNDGISQINIIAGITQFSQHDIVAALRSSSQYWWPEQESPFWLPKLSKSDRESARTILDSQLPGLSEMIEKKLQFRGMTDEESDDWVGGELYMMDKIFRHR